MNYEMIQAIPDGRYIAHCIVIFKIPITDLPGFNCGVTADGLVQSRFATIRSLLPEVAVEYGIHPNGDYYYLLRATSSFQEQGCVVLEIHRVKDFDTLSLAGKWLEAQKESQWYRESGIDSRTFYQRYHVEWWKPGKHNGHSVEFEYRCDCRRRHKTDCKKRWEGRHLNCQGKGHKCKGDCSDCV